MPLERDIDFCIDRESGTLPISVRPYQISLVERELKTQLQEILDIVFIHHRVSPWSAPVIFIKKMNGSLRKCIHYIKLNKLPFRTNISCLAYITCLNRGRVRQCFWKINLRLDYYKLKNRTEDLLKTTFRTCYSHYKFLVMLFVFKNTPSTFMRLLNQIFKSFLDLFVIMFTDDILVYSKIKEEYIGHLRILLRF